MKNVYKFLDAINTPAFLKGYIVAVFVFLAMVFICILCFSPVFNRKYDDLIEDAENNSTSSEISYIAVGDVMCHDGQLLDALNKETNTYDFSHCFTYIKDYISKADFASANYEGIVVSPETGYSGYPNFYTPSNLLDSLHNCGFDFLTMNNDEFFNNGYSGVLSTLEYGKESDINIVGIYDKESKNLPSIMKINNINIGLVTTMIDLSELVDADKYQSILALNDDYTQYANIYSREKVRKDIDLVKEYGADFIIVYIHWGSEDINVVTKEMQQTAKYIISSGADLIIGSNPHITMPLQRISVNDAKDINRNRMGYVAYSLGNFISNQRNNNGDIGVILNFTIRKIDTDNTRITNIEYIPIYTNVNIADGTNFTVLPAESASAVPPEWCDSYNNERYIRTYDTISNLLNFSSYRQVTT